MGYIIHILAVIGVNEIYLRSGSGITPNIRRRNGHLERNDDEDHVDAIRVVTSRSDSLRERAEH